MYTHGSITRVLLTFWFLALIRSLDSVHVQGGLGRVGKQDS